MTVVKAVMAHDVICAQPELPIREAMKLMDERARSYAIVCEDDTPVGIVTARDIVGFVAADFGHSWPEIQISELMTSPVITVGVDDPIERAADLTENHKISHVPTVDAKGRLVGIVNRADLLRVYVERMCRGSRSLGQLSVIEGSDRRGAPRFDLRSPVEFTVDEVVGTGTIWNISRSGALVEWSDAPPLPGTEVRLRISSHLGSSEVEFPAEVVRETESGFAVRFIRLGEHELEVLNAILPA